MTAPAAAAGPSVRVFLSGVQSVAHLLYASSYLDHLIEDSGASATLVDLGVGQFLGRANVSAQDLRGMLGKNPRLTVVGADAAEPWRSAPGERCIYIGVGAPGIKPYLRLRMAHPLRKLHVVVIDEGIGSYGNWRTKREAMRRQGGSEPWPSIRSLAVSAARVLLTDERWALFRRVDTGWSVDDRVAAAFRSQMPLPASRPRVGVFLSQPWVELGLITEVAYLAHVREIAEACTSAGFTFLVCPHPAEPVGRYTDFSLTIRRGPAELNPQVVGAALVIGATSSAMLNVTALYGTPAFRVVPPELSHLDSELSARQRSLIHAFLPVARPVSALSKLLCEQG